MKKVVVRVGFLALALLGFVQAGYAAEARVARPSTAVIKQMMAEVDAEPENPTLLSQGIWHLTAPSASSAARAVVAGKILWVDRGSACNAWVYAGLGRSFDVMLPSCGGVDWGKNIYIEGYLRPETSHLGEFVGRIYATNMVLNWSGSRTARASLSGTIVSAGSLPGRLCIARVASSQGQFDVRLKRRCPAVGSGFNNSNLAMAQRGCGSFFCARLEER